jgi:hypothetical protein
MTPEREREIRELEVGLAASPDVDTIDLRACVRDLLAEVDRLRDAAKRAALKLERRAADRATIDRLRAAHERLRDVARRILPTLGEDEAVTLGSALGEAPASDEIERRRCRPGCEACAASPESAPHYVDHYIAPAENANQVIPRSTFERAGVCSEAAPPEPEGPYYLPMILEEAERSGRTPAEIQAAFAEWHRKEYPERYKEKE